MIIRNRPYAAGVGAGSVPARLRKGLYIHNGRKVVVP